MRMDDHENPQFRAETHEHESGFVLGMLGVVDQKGVLVRED